MPLSSLWGSMPLSLQNEDTVNTEQESEILAETENLIAWRSNDKEGFIYHLELGTLSLHLMPEEWDELIVLVKTAAGR